VSVIAVTVRPRLLWIGVNSLVTPLTFPRDRRGPNNERVTFSVIEPVQRKPTLSVLGAIAFSLAISSAAAMVCLGWLLSAMPNSLAQRLSEQTLHLIGQAALSWLCFYFVLFALPCGVAIAVLRRTKLRGVLLRASGIASVLAMVPCYWAWRSSDVIMDFFIPLLAIPTVGLMCLHVGDRWVVKRWMGITVLVAYFGFVGWLFRRWIVPREFLLVPASGFLSSLVWARDIKSQPTERLSQ